MLKTRSYMASNNEIGLRAATTNNVGSQEYELHGTQHGRSVMRHSGHHNLNLVLQNAREGSDRGSSSLQKSSQGRRGTVYLWPSASKDQRREHQIPTAQNDRGEGQNVAAEAIYSVQRMPFQYAASSAITGESPGTHVSFQYQHTQNVDSAAEPRDLSRTAAATLGNTNAADKRRNQREAGLYSFKQDERSPSPPVQTGNTDDGIVELLANEAAEMQAEVERQIAEKETARLLLEQQIQNQFEQAEGLGLLQDGAPLRNMQSLQEFSENSPMEQKASMHAGSNTISESEASPGFRKAAGHPQRGKTKKWRHPKSTVEAPAAFSPPNALPYRASLVSRKTGRQLSSDNRAQHDLDNQSKTFPRFRSDDDLKLTGENKPIQRISWLRRGPQNPASIGEPASPKDQRQLQVVMHLKELDNKDLALEEQAFLVQGTNQFKPKSGAKNDQMT